MPTCRQRTGVSIGVAVGRVLFAEKHSPGPMNCKVIVRSVDENRLNNFTSVVVWI